ncbi:hypothetical protein [Lacinutrix chionoecetis]
MKQFYLFLIFLGSISLTAQTINGVVYNETSTIESIKIENLSNKNSVFTNQNGAFTIKAKVNDTLKASALFYIEQYIIVKPVYETETFVIQLKEAKNRLKEVIIDGTQKDKVADIVKLETALKNQILEDIKNNPHLYGKMPSGNLDLVKIIGLIGKLFKNKNKAAPFKPINYQDLDTLFNNNHTLFNDTLLTNTLKIDADKKFLFFEFYEAKSIDSQLLAKDKELELLETFIKVSEEFNTIIRNFNSKKTD